MDKKTEIVLPEYLLKAMKFSNRDNRPWLKMGYADSYGNESNRVEAWLLEGSPAVGFILHWVNYKRAVRLDSHGGIITQFDDEIETVLL
jgi:hypothetical protein